MLTILEFSKIAGHIYDISKPTYGYVSFKQTTVKNITDKDTKDKDTWCIMTDVDPTIDPANHFFAQLYLKFENGNATDAVVAVRGTLFTDKTNLGVDALSWYADVLGEGGSDSAPLSFTNSLISFIVKAQDYLRNYFPSVLPLKFTGHSLGGALAQLMPLKAGILGRAVVFNSPGVGHIPGVMPDKSNWVYNINSRYGLINKVGLTLGKVYLIDVPEREAEAKQLFRHRDQTDYATSEQLYQLADTLAKNKPASLTALGVISLTNGAGLVYRLGGYISTFNHLEQQPQAAHAMQMSCETADTHAWYNLKARLAVKLCTTEYKGNQLGQIIHAQHSIDNVVQALQMKNNAGLAYTYI